MGKLFRANGMRVKKDKIFWLCTFLTAVLAVYICGTRYIANIRYEAGYAIDEVMFLFFTVIGMICAAFCGLFLGTEYSDGTIRNKLMVGHRRNAVYLANLLTVFAAAMALWLIYAAFALALGLPTLGAPRMDWQEGLTLALCGVLVIAVFSSLFTMESMLCQSRAVASVTCITVFVMMLFASMMIRSRLEEPELWTEYVMSMNGEIVKGDPIPNPQYVGGVKRQIFLFLNEFLPTGQSIEVSSGSIEHPVRMALYSVFIVAASTAAGLLGFRRKDIH